MKNEAFVIGFMLMLIVAGCTEITGPEMDTSDVFIELQRPTAVNGYGKDGGIIIETAVSSRLVNFQFYNDHWYGLIVGEDPISWTDARVLAEDNGGYLVSINDQAENDFLTATYHNIPPGCGWKNSPIIGVCPALWIGLYEPSGEGSWAWVNGDPFTFSSWDTGEPNNAGDEDCANFWTSLPGVWNDDKCHLGRGAIFEFDSDPRIIDIVIDLHPGGESRSIQCKSAGSVSIAVLSTTEFDATSLDANTVRFGPTGTEAAERHQKNGEARRHVEDVNGDGLSDMVFHFLMADIGVDCTDVPPGEQSISIDVFLTGSTNTGANVEGEDVIELKG